MSFDGLPPSLQISSSKSQFLSPKFRTLSFRKQLPFYRKIPRNAKIVLRCCKSELDFVPSEHDFLRDKMSQKCSKIVARCCKSEHDFSFVSALKISLFAASNSCTITWTQLKLHKNYNKSVIWPSLINLQEEEF